MITVNLTNYTEPTRSEMMSDRPEAIVVPILFAAIFLVGVLGNGTLVYIVARNKNLRNAPNILIVSLALGDLVLLLVSVPFTATIYTFNDWPYGEAMCKLNSFLQCFSVGVSVFTLVALSADRYTAIVHPMQRHGGSPMTRSLITAGMIWFLSAVLAIPEAVAARIEQNLISENRYLEICKEHPPTWGEVYPKYIVTFRFIIYFALPLVVIGVFYFLMARILVLSSRHIPGETQAKASSQHQKQTEARKKVAKLVLSFVVIFIICWLPRYIYLLWFYFDPGNYNLFWHVFKITGFCFCFINSCVNPMALYFLSKQFRGYYNRTLFFICSYRSRSRSPEQSYVYNFHSTDVGKNNTSITMTLLPQKTAYRT